MRDEQSKADSERHAERACYYSCMIVILAVAAVARLPYLNFRPMHADEANQAVKTADLWSTGHYHYDTADHHGPTLYYLTLPALWASGAIDFAHTSEANYRVVPVVFGLAVIAILPLFADGLGWLGVLAAAAFMAVSPACVYYSRYYIQETPLVFFTLAALGCSWRFICSRRSLWLIAAGLSVGLMHATKETWIFSAAAAACGLAICLLCNRATQRRWLDLVPYLKPAGRAWYGAIPWLLALLTAATIASLLFSGFCDSDKESRLGPWHSITAYASYWHRSGLPEHTEPWYYYLQILFAFRPSRGFFWSEGALAALAIVGAVAAVIPKAQDPRPKANASADLGRFLAVYTMSLLGIYSAISYKTPWCGLSILCGVILLAGYGVNAILEFTKPRFALLGMLIAAMLVMATIGHLGWQAYRLSTRFAADARNPYVYAHTPPSLAEFAQRLDRMAERLPQGHGLSIHVIVPESYWPLPWYLRRFDSRHVGYWLDADAWKAFMATADQPDIVLVAEPFKPMADELLEKDPARTAYNCQMLISLRPGTIVRVYVRSDLWPAMVGNS